MGGSINVAGVPSSTFGPGVYLNLILGGSGSSAGAAQKRILLLGNMIAAAIVGASPAFNLAAGTAAVEQLVQISSLSDAQTLFGFGSELSRMAARIFEMYPDANLWACPVAESAGTAASTTLTFATNATSAATLRLYLGGQILDVPLNGTSTTPLTPTAFATTVCQYVNALTTLPMTAQFAAGVVTFTAKHKGPRGNNLQCRAQWINGATTTEVGSAATASGTGMTGAFAGATKKLTLGATADSNANALAAILALKFDRIVSAANDATQLAALRDQINQQAGAGTQIRQQAICATIDTLGNATTLAADPTTGLNAPRVQIVWQKNGQNPPEEIAAQVAAARLNGDSLVGGGSFGEASSAAANLDGTLLRSIKQAFDSTDLPTSSDHESALHNGLTSLQVSSARPGYVAIRRSITSRSLDANKQQNYGILDTTNPTVGDYITDDLQSDLFNAFQHCNLASDSADGTAPKTPDTVTPRQIRNRIARKLQGYQDDLGIIRNVKAHLGQLQVVEDVTGYGRVNCEIPAEVIPGLHIIAGNVRTVPNAA